MNFWNNPFTNWNNLWPYTFDLTTRYFFPLFWCVLICIPTFEDCVLWLMSILIKSCSDPFSKIAMFLKP